MGWLRTLELLADAWHDGRGLRESEMKQSDVAYRLMAALAACLFLAVPSTAATAPNPVLHFTGTERYSAGGRSWVRYRFDVLNKALYPAALFAASPALPPCGTNTNASRTWVDFFDQDGKRLYGFCALGSPANLGAIWFAVEEGKTPPSRVYIEMSDRLTNTRYRSNLAETSR